MSATNDISEKMQVTAVRLQINPGKRDEFLQVANSLIEPTRAEPGCISYSFYEDPNAKNVFLFIEEYKNQKAFDFHFQTPYVKAYMEKLPTWLAQKTSARMYEINKLTTVDVEPADRT